MEDIEVLNKILYDFIYESEDPCIEDFYLVDNFKSIILDNKIKLIPSNYHNRVNLERSIRHSYEFLKTIDRSYADKLMSNIENGVVHFYRRGKDDTTNAQIVVDETTNKSRILIPYNSTIEDSYAITHEQLHDTNMDPNNLNATCGLFTEMISFLGELLQRDYFQKKDIAPKEYRNNMKDSFYATKNYAVSMNMELDLIRRFLSKGFVTYQDMREICQNKTIEELEIMSDQLEDILNNGELNYYKSQMYIIGNVLACYLHQKILDNPKKIFEFTEVNQLINEFSVDNIFDYLELDMKDYKFLNLTPDSYKVLKKCYNNEIKRL